MPLSNDSFDAVTEMFHRVSGIRLTPAKRSLVEGRLLKLARERGLSDINDYVRVLLDEGDSGEQTRAVDKLTTNETYFFREPQHFQHLEAWLRGEGKRHQPLKVWSAASSSGEEAYSLAILLLESVTPREAWSLEVQATDINASALAAAQEGVYSGRSLDGVSPDRLAAFFEPVGQGRYSVRPEVRRIVRFRRHSLLEPPPVGLFDVVVCRNLLIYLRPEVVGDVLDGFGSVLRPDGALLLGDADVPALYSRKWSCVALGDAAYHRPIVEALTR